MIHLSILIAVNFGVLGFAMTNATEWGPPVGASAIITTVLGWFMFRQDKKNDNIAKIMTHVASSLYMNVLTSRAADALLKQDARKGLRELRGEKPDDTTTTPGT